MNINTIKSKIISFIYDYISTPLHFNVVYFRDLKKIKAAIGSFEQLSRKDIRKDTIFFKDDSRNVTGVLVPEIVRIVSDLSLSPACVLLDGDDKSVTEQIKKRFNFGAAKVITAGKGDNFHYSWDFEEDLPSGIPANIDLIISQAMFEHLIDPYKHLEDLARLLKPGGFLVIHSVMPGYTYHRFPIDAVRFFPDWFESSATKLGLKVQRKFMRDFHLVYLFKKNG